MTLTTYRDLLKEQIKDLYSAETQLLRAFPSMVNAASNPDLKEAFSDHMDETRKHIDRLMKTGMELEIDLQGETCNAMRGLIEEAEELINTPGSADVKDAGLIAAAQRVEHYEIAAYGTVCQLLEETSADQSRGLLHDTLEEEKSANCKLTKLAVGEKNVAGVNEKAM